jgi:hypothetical protein
MVDPSVRELIIYPEHKQLPAAFGESFEPNFHVEYIG